MLRNKSLVITSKDDAHADYVITKANDLGVGDQIVRLNTEDFNNNCLLSFKDGNFSISIKDSARSLSSAEIMSVWFRRPKDIVAQHPDPDASQYMKIQATAFLRGLYFCCHNSALWINPLPALHRARIKLQQIQQAINLGFDVPHTIVSNSPQELIDFFDRHEVVCTKSLDEPNFLSDGAIYPIFTRVIDSKEDLTDNVDSLRLCPILLQEYIEKTSDIRVIVLGDKVFAVEIFSQDHELAIHDFRGVAPKFLKHKVHNLPCELKIKIQNFVKQQGLYYSALDFVLSKNKKYYFLENNPNGQWLWLESMASVDISGCLLEALLG
jgi:glutathione synthase/RimK-type ligase-like ATP-grasp enzyme